MFQFSSYGKVIIDWPHKNESKSKFPPKGYAFLIFEKDKSVQNLINSCLRVKDDKFYTRLSSKCVKDKPVRYS